MENSNKFLQIIKNVIIIAFFIIFLAIIFCLISFFKDLFNKNKIDGDYVLKNTLEEIIVSGDFEHVTDEEKDIVNEEMSKPTATKINDIISELSVYDYKDIVVFVKNEKGSKSDMYSHNVVFRKTEKGLVFDGMFLLYGMFGYTQSSVSNYLGKTDYVYYAKYNNYDFQKSIEWRAKGYTHSCFSFNDNVSKGIMLNSNLACNWWNPVKYICQVFSSYNEIYNYVSKYCLTDIIKSFTSFGENQHLMFDFKTMDSFSDFWTDIYNSISVLQKNCLVNYTNSSSVGLYSGVIGSETCKYYNASSYFKINYTYLGKKAYAINSKDYSKNHEFNCENKASAIPEINFIAEYDTTSETSFNDLLKYITNNNYKMKFDIDIKTSSTEDVVNFETNFFDFVQRNGNLYKNYFDLNEYKINTTCYIDKNDGNGYLKSNIITFNNGSFTIDTKISRVKILFSVHSLLPEHEIVQKNSFILNDNTFKNVHNSQSPETNEECSYSFLLNYSDYGINSLEELFNENINSYFLKFKENEKIGSIISSYCSTKQYYSNSKYYTYYIFYFKSNSGLTNNDMSILFCPLNDNTLSFLAYVNIYNTNGKYFSEYMNSKILGDLTFQSRFFGDLEFTLNFEKSSIN